MARCQQLGKPSFKGSYWADGVSEPGCWRDTPCARVHRYIFSLADLPPAQSERGAGGGCWCSLCFFESVCELRDWPHTRAYMWPKRVLCVCLLTGNTFSASVLVGPGAMELHSLAPFRVLDSA